MKETANCIMTNFIICTRAIHQILSVWSNQRWWDGL